MTSKNLKISSPSLQKQQTYSNAKKNYLLNHELPPVCKCKSPGYAIVTFSPPIRVIGNCDKAIFAFEDGSSVTDEEMMYYLNQQYDY